jgi:hypothetical protein
LDTTSACRRSRRSSFSTRYTRWTSAPRARGRSTPYPSSCRSSASSSSPTSAATRW